jgi:hypothetical protein
MADHPLPSSYQTIDLEHNVNRRASTVNRQPSTVNRQPSSVERRASSVD